VVDYRAVLKYPAVAEAAGRVQACVGPSRRQRDAAFKTRLLIISVVNEQCRSVDGRHGVRPFELFARHAVALLKTSQHGAPDMLADADVSRKHAAIAD